MTNAQVAMDTAIKRKWLDIPQKQKCFKLKRFTENIDPRVSTKRGEKPYMIA